MDLLVVMLSEIEEILTGRSMFNIEDGLCWFCLAVLHDRDYSEHDPIVEMPSNEQIECLMLQLKMDKESKTQGERAFLEKMRATLSARVHREHRTDKVEDFSGLSSLDIAIGLVDGLMKYPGLDEHTIIELFRNAFSERNRTLNT